MVVKELQCLVVDDLLALEPGRFPADVGFVVGFARCIYSSDRIPFQVIANGTDTTAQGCSYCSE